MTLRKKLTEYPAVIPTYNDYVAGNQTNTVKQFKFADIYTLFKSSFDSVYATIASLANYVTNTSLITTLLNYVTNSALVATLANYTTTSALTTLLNGKQNIFVANTAAVQLSTVTINAKSGVAQFSAPLNPSAIGTFTIISSFGGLNKNIICSLAYDADKVGYPQIVNHYSDGFGIVLNIKNIGIVTTNGNLKVTFIFLD